MKQSGIMRVLVGGLVFGLVGMQATVATAGRLSGAGHYDSPVIGRTYVAINAAQNPDGSVSGQFEQNSPEVSQMFGAGPGDAGVHGIVNCLFFVDDHTVVASGIVTEVHGHNIPDALSFIQPGSPFALLVQDNGNGHGAGPDLTGPFLTDVPGITFSCEDAADTLDYLLPGLLPLTGGNFQVAR